MGILSTIIENWAKVHGVKAYTLRHETLNAAQMQGRLVCAPGCVFFYKFEADGLIDNVSDLNKPLCTIKTHDDFLDVGAITMRSDGGTIQHAETNFVLTSDSEAFITLHRNDPEQSEKTAQFATIYNAALHYVKLTPLDGEFDNKREIKVEI